MTQLLASPTIPGVPGKNTINGTSPREHIAGNGTDDMIARVEGTPIPALCGVMFVPLYDPTTYGNICPECTHQQLLLDNAANN